MRRRGGEATGSPRSKCASLHDGPKAYGPPWQSGGIFGTLVYSSDKTSEH